MNSRYWTLALVLVVGAAAARSDDSKPEKPTARSLSPGARIAVVALNSNGGSQVDRVVGDMTIGALRRAGMRVVERQEIDVLAREQQLVRDGIVDPATAPPGGKVLGAEYILGLKATEFGVRDDRVGGAAILGPLLGIQLRSSTARVVLDARLLDAKTGLVLATFTGEGREVSHGGTLLGGRIRGRSIDLGGIDVGSKEWAESTLGKAARKAVGQIVKQVRGPGGAAEGTILAAALAGEVVVDVGGFDGVQVGDVLDVVRLERVRDSKGAVVWTDERPVGEIRVTELRGDRAKGVFTGSGSPAEGDVVRTRTARPRR